MMNTTEQFTDLLMMGSNQYTNTAMGVAQLVMLAGIWVLKFKKRLSNNKMKRTERVTEL